MKKIILIADDDKNLLEMNNNFVKHLFNDFEIELFSDGTSLEKRLCGNLDDVNLVITDNEMPGIKGSEIILKYGNDIPFLLAYGGDRQIGEQAIKDGAKGYLLKPFSLSDFKTKVQESLKYI